MAIPVNLAYKLQNILTPQVLKRNAVVKQLLNAKIGGTELLYLTILGLKM